MGHLVREYLPRSQTFIHTLITAQSRYRPVVLAGHVTRRPEFPVEELVELASDGTGRVRRAARRTRARAGGWDITWQQRAFRAARDAGCVALHAHFGPFGWRAVEVARRLGVPLVTTFYGHDLALPGNEARWAERYSELFAKGDLFTCEGPAMAAQLAAIGCPHERIRLVRIGTHVTRFPFQPRAPRGELVFIQTGRFVPKKGIDLSIRAFAAAGGRDRDWQLWLVGDGPERDALEALAAQLGVGNAVRFLGSLSHSDYRTAMAAAQIGLQPSRTAPDGDTEGGAPTVLLEMQASGLPVIASTHADIPFVVADEDALVPEDDVDALAGAMLRMSEMSGDEWLGRAERGREFVIANHEAASVAAQAEAVYDEARAAATAGDAGRRRELSLAHMQPE